MSREENRIEAVLNQIEHVISLPDEDGTITKAIEEALAKHHRLYPGAARPPQFALRVGPGHLSLVGAHARIQYEPQARLAKI